MRFTEEQRASMSFYLGEELPDLNSLSDEELDNLQGRLKAKAKEYETHAAELTYYQYLKLGARQEPH